MIPSDVLGHADGSPPDCPLAIDVVGYRAGHDYERAQHLTMPTVHAVSFVRVDNTSSERHSDR